MTRRLQVDHALINMCVSVLWQWTTLLPTLTTRTRYRMVEGETATFLLASPDCLLLGLLHAQIPKSDDDS